VWKRDKNAVAGVLAELRFSLEIEKSLIVGDGGCDKYVR